MAGPAMAQCDYDLCGYWYSDDYNAGVPVEYLSIEKVGNEWHCRKVLGDPYVPTGHLTWKGVQDGCTIIGSVYGTSGIGAPIVPLAAQLFIVSADELEMTGQFTMDFQRSTVEHLEFVGIDTKLWPIACFPCGSLFPNVFTPNSDGVNDLFEPTCTVRSQRFSIRDRWGKVVFETEEEEPSWDGRDKWHPCDAGVYFWSMIDADDRTGEIRHGTVQILR